MRDAEASSERRAGTLRYALRQTHSERLKGFAYMFIAYSIFWTVLIAIVLGYRLAAEGATAGEILSSTLGGTCLLAIFVLPLFLVLHIWGNRVRFKGTATESPPPAQRKRTGGRISYIGLTVDAGWRAADGQATESDIDGLLSMSAPSFEERMALLLTRMGYRVLALRTLDGEHLDIKAAKGGDETLFRVARYPPWKAVESDEVRTLKGAREHERQRCLFVTTSSFTADAADVGLLDDVDLLDGGRLGHLLRKYSVPRSP